MASSAVIVLGVIYTLWTISRYNSFNEDWPEYERYLKRVEIEFAESLSDQYIDPFHNDMDAALKRALEKAGLNVDKLKSDVMGMETSLGKTPEDVERGDFEREPHATALSFKQALEEVFDEIPDPEEMSEAFDKEFSEVLGVNLEDAENPQEALEADSLFVTYLVKNDHLDPTTAHKNAREFYQEHRRLKLLKKGVEGLMIVSLVSFAVPIIAWVAGRSVTNQLFAPVIMAFVGWTVLEFIMWRKVRTKVTTSESKFLQKYFKRVFEVAGMVN